MNKPKAKGDLTYCTNKSCKKECWRKEDNWEFDNSCVMYTFINKCDEYKEEK